MTAFYLRLAAILVAPSISMVPVLSFLSFCSHSATCLSHNWTTKRRSFTSYIASTRASSTTSWHRYQCKNFPKTNFSGQSFVIQPSSSRSYIHKQQRGQQRIHLTLLRATNSNTHDTSSTTHDHHDDGRGGSKEDGNQEVFLDQDKKEFVTMQGDVSRKESSMLGSSSTTAEDEHIQHQQRVFDKMAHYFASGETVTPDIIPVYQHLANKLLEPLYAADLLSDEKQAQLLQSTQQEQDDSKPSMVSPILSTPRRYRILDVGCGSGVLHPFLIAATSNTGSNNNEIQLDITGVDLSAQMIDAAQHQVNHLLQNNNMSSRHSIHLIQSDILKFNPHVQTLLNNGKQTSPFTSSADVATPTSVFDLIVVNACFGNFWDPLAVLRHLVSLLAMNGRLVISHPLGSDFVRQLHEADMVTVPHLLPTYKEFHNMTRCLPIQVLDFVDGTIELAMQSRSEESNATVVKSRPFPLYYASAVRVRFAELPRVIRLRGMVDAGYGRGGKKLGFPTANLPSRLFQNALENVQPGVYFGWALLEDKTNRSDRNRSTATGRNMVHKAVVNVGYSPTFQGEENREKIVEAHLILDSSAGKMDPPDFYNEAMRLQLIGYMRPEIKFANFAALIAQIRADVQDADRALDMEPYQRFQSDRFFQYSLHSGSDWVGALGGDSRASWEFEDIYASLNHLGQ